MYHPINGFRFTPGEVAVYRDLAESLGLAAPGGSTMPDSDRCTYLFHPILYDRFPGVWAYCTLVVLEPSAQIVLHSDPWTGALTRYHVPLQQNEGCWVYSEPQWEDEDDETGWERLQVGQVYRMHPGLPHGAVNWGSTRRIHLLVDVAR